MLNVFVRLPSTDINNLASIDSEFDDVFVFIDAAFRQVAAEIDIDFWLYRTKEELRSKIKNKYEKRNINAIYDLINRADIIVIDVSRQRESMLFELGYIYALGTPTVAICQSEVTLPLDIQHPIVPYDRNKLNKDLVTPLKQQIMSIVAESNEITHKHESRLQASRKDTAKAFEGSHKPVVIIDYNDADESYCNDLMDFLLPLETKGLCIIWSKKKLEPGDLIEDEINEVLNKAKIAVILLSQKFVVESQKDLMHQQLLSAKDENNIRIIPINVSANVDDSALQGLQFVNKGEALADMRTDEDRRKVYRDVEKLIEKLL